MTESERLVARIEQTLDRVNRDSDEMRAHIARTKGLILGRPVTWGDVIAIALVGFLSSFLQGYVSPFWAWMLSVGLWIGVCAFYRTFVKGGMP
jgi:hypothetical protein